MILYFSLMIYLINLGNGKYEISKGYSVNVSKK